MFSLTLFLTRLLSGLTLLYITIGCLLFYREFLYNATAMGLPLHVPAGLALVVAELFLSLLLMLGWFTRPAAGLAVLSTAGLAAVFFAADFNKLYVALLIFIGSRITAEYTLRPRKNQFRLFPRGTPRQ